MQRKGHHTVCCDKNTGRGNIAGGSKPAQLQIAARHNPWLAASLSSHESSAVCQWDPQTACTHDLIINRFLTLLSDKRGCLVVNMMVRMQSSGKLCCYAVAEQMCIFGLIRKC